MSLSFLLLICLSLLSLSEGKQYPIQPGTAYVDLFIPLDNSQVYVSDFTTVDFGASVLDFRKSTN